MKNIHVLPTDKPSRLQKNKYNKFFLSEEPKSYSDCTNQNIYITSDEEIKEADGSWIIDLRTNKIAKNINNHIKVWNENCKKIILTTDQDLIKDGVQAIDDEFLEWFVKNPSCEFVEITTYGNYLSLHHSDSFHSVYKIIIPKEECDYTALLQPVGTREETLEEREWFPIFKEYVKDNECNLYTFFNWLETNYNSPTKK
jgi:hypothetical protein